MSPRGKPLPMFSLTLHMGPSGDVLRTSERLLGTPSGRNFSDWVGAYSVTKRNPSKVLAVRGPKYFLQVRNKERGGFVELGHFDKRFVKNTRIKSSTGNISEFFLVDTPKTIFWIQNLTRRWTQSWYFSPKPRSAFTFFTLHPT